MSATKTYSTKSNATRAAKQAGLSAANCFQVADGTWGFRALAVDLGTYHTAHIDAYAETTWPVAAKPYRIVQGKPARVAARKATLAARKATLAAKKAAQAPKAAAVATPKAGAAPTHKEFALYGRSAILSPVQFVHQFLNAKGGDMTRKQAIQALSEAGVNYSTARTQYQRWFTARKG